MRGTDELPNLILKNLENEGQNIRKAYTRRLPSNPNKDYYFIHRNTGITEPIIVEYGFLDSTKDDSSQLKNNWPNYAEAVVKSIAEYLNIPYSLKNNDNEYVVKSGDTLWSIAKLYNTSVNELKKANNLDTNMLRIGMILNLPINNNTYMVKKGDTLYSIAKKYNVNVNELEKLNNLSTTILKIGEILQIPINNDNEYVVKSGDTLWSIAKKYNRTVNEIKELNNITSDILSVGQIIKVN